MSEKRAATYEDIVNAPEDKIAEIIEGDLHLTPRPVIRHAHATSILGADLIEGFHRGRRGPGGWWILVEPEIHLEANVFVPDLAGWRRERLPSLPDEPAFTIAPDWVCEVLSPSTMKLDRKQKFPLYAYHRVGFLWFVDPGARRLEVFERENGFWGGPTIHEGNASVRAAPFDAIEIDLSAVWMD